MQGHTAQPGQWVSYAISAIVIAVVFAIRWRRMGRTRPLKIERLWMFPAFYLLIAAYMFWQFPPHGFAWALCAVALVAGAALGWQRGRMMRISVDPETHALNQSASPAAMLFILVLIVIRSGARYALNGDNMLHLNALAATDMLIALALGLFAAQRLEMYLRAKRMLDATRGAASGPDNAR